MEFTDALAKFEMEVEDFLSFGKVSTCRDGQHPQARLWHPFLAGILAINVDASVGGGSCALEMVVRDSEGCLKFSASCWGEQTDPAKAEL